MQRRLRDLASVRELVRAEAPLRHIAEQYGVQLTQSGSDGYKGLCPFHDEDTPSFGISISKGLFHCFGCKTGGDVFRFVELQENLTHVEAVVHVAQMVGFDLDPFYAAVTPEEERAAALYAANQQVFEAHRKEIKSKRFKEWQKERQFLSEVLEEYGVGYTAEGAESRWHDAIVVPVRDASGRVAGFRNRPLTGKLKVIGPPEDHPLPMPPVYGLAEARKAIRKAGYAILVEGEPDVWQMVAHGYGNTISMQGSKLNAEMIAYLKDHAVTKITVLADNDEAGRKFTRKLARSRLDTDITIKIALLEGSANDPDKVLLADGTGPIQRALNSAQHVAAYLVNVVLEDHDVTSITGKLDALNDLRDAIKDATSIERDLITKIVAEKLNTDVAALTDFFREGDTNNAQLHNIAAERTVLRRMLDDPNCLGDAVLAMRKDDFYLSKHQAIFEAIDTLYRAQKAVNIDTVRTYLDNRGVRADDVLRVGNVDLVDDNTAAFLIADIKDKAIRRTVRARALAVAQRLGDTGTDARIIVQDLSREIARAVVGTGDAAHTASSLVHDRMSLMHERLKSPNAIVGLDLGPDWPVLNYTLHGIQRKRYIVVAAPAGVGKTGIACGWLRRFTVDLDVPCLYLTFETGKEALTDRIIANISGVESDKVITGYLNKKEIDLVHDAAAQFGAAPAIISERGRNAEECMSLIRHHVLTMGVQVVFVDYLQLMYMEDTRGKARHQEIGDISRMLLESSHELDITTVALAQLNREGTKAGAAGKESIGDSYRISQDADVFYAVREKTKEEIAHDGIEFGDAVGVLDKNRHGKDHVITSLSRDMSISRIRESSKASHIVGK